jgi:hypothetical protein|tara:strand:+ start:720 stop:875 length:156 start_codon:yes stop_codon:yes gene_type:complete
MKRYWILGKEKVIDFVVSNWQTDGYYNKGKIIFIGVVLFFMIWKLLYSIFA